MPARDVLHIARHRLAEVGHGRYRLIATGVATAATAVAAAMAARRHKAESVTLPDPTGLANETAVSVHNAAKSTMLSAARAAESADLELITRTVQDAIADGIEAGVDLVPVAIGVVGGALEAAHLFDLAPRDLAVYAATVSIRAATVSGETAANRIREAFSGLPLGLPDPSSQRASPIAGDLAI